jgi:hypothetical protein
MTDVGRLNAIQDHAREGDDVGEGLAVSKRCAPAELSSVVAPRRANCP